MPHKDETEPEITWAGRAAAFLLGLLALVLLWGAVEAVFSRLYCARVPSGRPPLADFRAEQPLPLRIEPRAGGLVLLPPPPVPGKEKASGQITVSGRSAVVKETLPEAAGGRTGRRVLRETMRSCRGALIYRADYVLDEFNRRETPGEDKKTARRFLLLMGDSSVFGQGLGQRETLAFYLGRLLPGRKVYNYGISRLFPGELLDRARAIPATGELREKTGTVLYFYNPVHMRRNMGSFFDIGTWAPQRPYYFEDKNGEIVTRGSHAETRPLRTLLARLFARSAVAGYFNLDWPARPGREDWQFEIKLLLQLQAAARKFGTDKFCVVIGPDDPGTPLTGYLEQAGLRYIDLGGWKMQTLTRGGSYIPNDGHPTAETNSLLAAALAPLIN